MQIHLIRHGEVENPGNVVYANVPGFVLSAKGRFQASVTGQHLKARPPRLVVSSPLDRAVETAGLIAAETGSEVATDDRLTEWALAVRWRGARWDQLPTVFPGELEAYLDNPRDLPFCPESIDQVADRIATAVTEWAADSRDDIAFVSHEDPIHASHLLLTQSNPSAFHQDKPVHSSVTTIERDGARWRTVAYWAPPQ
jgi:broad specificity phosphatase PhoE